VDIEAIKARVRSGKFVISAHADQEAADEDIDIAEICDAIYIPKLPKFEDPWTRRRSP
jgi:hypothetical protein